MILFLFRFAPVERMNYVIEIFLPPTICWWRVWRESEIVSTFMHFKVEEVWVCISPIRKWKTAWHIILFRLESLIPHLKLFRMLLQTVAVAKDNSRKGMQANGKLITIFGYCQKIHLHFFVGNINLLRNIDHWVLISLNFDAIHPKCTFVSNCPGQLNVWHCLSVGLSEPTNNRSQLTIGAN